MTKAIETGSLAGLDFTDAAWPLAEEAGLTRADFAGIKPDGKKGEYKVFQVEEVIALKQKVAVGEARAKEMDFETYDWHGNTGYRCPICAFDSFDRGALVRHVARNH